MEKSMLSDDDSATPMEVDTSPTKAESIEEMSLFSNVLPMELRFRIFSMLSWRELETMGMTCREFQHTSRHNGLWFAICHRMREYAMQIETQYQSTYIKTSTPVEPAGGVPPAGGMPRPPPLVPAIVHGNLSSEEFLNYMLGCRLERVIRWIAATCNGPNSTLIFSYDDPVATLCNWPTQLHFSLSMFAGMSASRNVPLMSTLSTRQITNEIPPHIFEISTILTELLSKSFCALVAPVTKPMDTKSLIGANDPMTIVLGDEEHSHYALRMPLRKLVTDPVTIWRTLMHLCWIDHTREYQAMVSASNCSIFYNIKLRALLATEVAVVNKEYSYMAKETIVEYPSLTKPPPIERLREIEREKPMSALTCCMCSRLVGVRDMDLFDSPQMSTLKPFVNQTIHYCSTHCLVASLEQRLDHYVPCANSRCSEHIPINRMLGVFSDAQSVDESKSRSNWHRTMDTFNLRLTAIVSGMDQFITDVVEKMRHAERFMDENQRQWHHLLGIGPESYTPLGTVGREYIRFYAARTQGPNDKVLVENDWPVRNMAQTALVRLLPSKGRDLTPNPSVNVSKFNVDAMDIDADSTFEKKADDTSDITQIRYKRFGLFTTNLDQHLTDMGAPYATQERMNKPRSVCIYDLPFSTIGLDLPIVNDIMPVPHLIADGALPSAFSYLEHVVGEQAQLNCLAGLKFRGYCSGECQRGVEYRPTRCLNGACQRRFDILFAPLTLSCMELVRIKIERHRDGEEKTSEHLAGYVCDEFCAQHYLVDRGAKLLLRQRQRKMNH